MTADDHMLPPDNFQEDPQPVLAHRTSPTNIGLYLLSVVAARDFGWIGTIDAVERLEATLATMGRLQRYRGHFFNWYDTRDLRPLDPRYVSSVDSGNLAAHLIALASACDEWQRSPVLAQQAVSGSATLSTSRARLCRCCRTTCARKPSPAISSKMRWTISMRRCGLAAWRLRK